MEQEVELRKIGIRSVFKFMLILGIVCGLLIGGGVGSLEGNITDYLTVGLLWGILLAFGFTFFAYLYNLFASITGGIKVKLRIEKEPEEE